jgi:hypothetical protein
MAKAIDPLEADPAVKKWLDEYRPPGRRGRLCDLRGFLRWLRANGPEHLRGLTPSQLVEYQRAASRNGNEYEILDALQAYIRQKPGTHSSLHVTYSAVRSFFLHNRAPLPRDPFRIKATRPPVRALLSISDLRTLINAADLGMKAFYLTLLQSAMDQERFQYFNIHFAKALADHLKEKGVNEPFMIELPGRKQSLDKTPFYTFIGRDALEAWKEYFDRIRGWPKEGEPLMWGRRGRPLSKSAILQKHIRLLEKLKYVKRGGGDTSRRYGYNLHEIRDIFRSLLHTKAKKDGFDEACAEFWMGHEVDPNNYDKFYMDKEYVLKHYRIAEKYLNIISGPRSAEDAEEMIGEILKRKEYIIALGRALQAYGFKLEAG